MLKIPENNKRLFAKALLTQVIDDARFVFRKK